MKEVDVHISEAVYTSNRLYLRYPYPVKEFRLDERDKLNIIDAAQT